MKSVDRSDPTTARHKRAEEIEGDNALQSADDLASLSPEETRQKLQELQVEKIELERQSDEMRRALADIKALQTRYLDLYDRISVGCCTLNAQGLILEANCTLAVLLGVVRDSLLHQPFPRFIFNEDQDILHLLRNNILEATRQQGYELRMVHSDGTVFWAQIEAIQTQGEGDAFTCQLLISDITERKHAGKNLRCYEHSLTAVLNASTDAISLISPDGSISVANETLARQLQRSVGDLIGRNIFEMIPSETARDRKAWVDKVVATGNSCTHIEQCDDITFETSLYPVVEKPGPVTQVAIFSKDVSDRISADNDLHHSQLLLNATQRLTRVGGWEWNVDAQSMLWTDETYHIHGFSPEDKVTVSAELIQRSLSCYLPADRPIIAKAFRHCAEAGVPYDLRFPFVAADGRQLWVRTMANPVCKDGRVILVRGNIMDITQQVEQEHHLRIYHNIVSSTTDAIAYLDSNYRYVLVNDAYERFSGINREHFLGLSVAEYLGDTVFEKTVKPMFDRCLQGEVVTYQQWFDYPALGRRYIDVSYFPYRNDDNRITGVIANSRDITDQIRIEEALRASEERFRFTFDYSPVGTAIVAPDFRFLRANSSLCRLVGYSEEELQRRTFADITHPEERERDVEQAQRLLAGEIDRYDAEKRYLCKHGGTVWAQVKVNLVRDADQQPLFFLPIIQDITARKEAEKALAESESSYARIVETAQEGIWAMDSQRQTTYVNRHMAAMLGYAPDEMLGCLVEDFLFREDLGDFFRRVRDRKQGRGEVYENRFCHKNGRAIWAIVSATALQDEEGRFTGAFAMITDITERKEAEIRIQQQADFNRRVLDSTPAHIAILDPQGIIIDINTPWNRFFMENNGTQEETIGRGTSYFCSWSTEYGDTTNAEQAFEGIRQVQRGEKDCFTIDYPCHSPDEERWFSLRVFPLQGGDGKVLVSHTDISALKQTEKNLNAALAEKEVLLREVHHRVKNNLAAIISLLDMQRRSSGDRLGSDDLAELSGRIRSMSLIHEKLYQSENMARIDFEQYLQSLIFNLRTSFGKSDIQFHLAARDVQIPLDLAVPCGMIINELMTNALKYAFPQGKPAPGKDVCRIEAGMQQKDGVYRLYVADNGVGLPPGFDWTTTKTLGLVLVRMLGCHQLSGRYAIDQQEGLRFTLTFSAEIGQLYQVH